MSVDAVAKNVYILWVKPFQRAFLHYQVWVIPILEK